MPEKFNPLPELNFVRSQFYTDPTSPSGLRNKITRNPRALKDQVSGCSNGKGYYQVAIKGLFYSSHRLVWYLETFLDPGNDYIDHCDQNCSNNSIENLRLATKANNGWNRLAPKNNKSGYKNIFWRKDIKKWSVKITAQGNAYNLGCYESIEEAIKVYNQAAKVYHGSFASLLELQSA